MCRQDRPPETLKGKILYQSKLFLLRGPSGSGKSTFADTLLRAGIVDHVFEADQFMIDDKGNYAYDRDRLQYCHGECKRLSVEALSRGDNVAVANTFTKRWEVAAYFELTRDVTVVTVEGNFPNIHGVPDNVVAHQRNRMERWIK